MERGKQSKNSAPVSIITQCFACKTYAQCGRALQTLSIRKHIVHDRIIYFDLLVNSKQQVKYEPCYFRSREFQIGDTFHDAQINKSSNLKYLSNSSAMEMFSRKHKYIDGPSCC